MTPLLTTNIEHGLCAGAAAACFAVLLNVPLRTLLGCALTGLLAYEVRSLLMAAGLADIIGANLCASLFVSLSSVAWGRRLRAPAVVFVMPGIIPLIPGALAFRTIVGVAGAVGGRAGTDDAALVVVALNGLRTALATAALATGVAVPSMLLRPKRRIL
jgi:uncharacterized membrane protein YjjB (DUF3815 family)